MQLYQCGPRIHGPNKKATDCLGYYLLDQVGNLYSLNSRTYCTKYGYQMYKLSDESCNLGGQLHNTLRTELGVKVTVTRAELIRKFLNDAWAVSPNTREGGRIYSSYYKMMQNKLHLMGHHLAEAKSSACHELWNGMLFLLLAMGSIAVMATLVN